MRDVAIGGGLDGVAEQVTGVDPALDHEVFHPVYEVTLVVEVDEDFGSKIIACDGFMLDFTEPFEGETVDY